MCATVLLALVGLMVWAPDLFGGRGNYILPVALFGFSIALAIAPVGRRLRDRRSTLAAVLREWAQRGENYVPADPAEFERRVEAFLISEAVVARWPVVADGSSRRAQASDPSLTSGGGLQGCWVETVVMSPWPALLARVDFLPEDRAALDLTGHRPAFFPGVPPPYPTETVTLSRLWSLSGSFGSIGSWMHAEPGTTRSASAGLSRMWSICEHCRPDSLGRLVPV